MYYCRVERDSTSDRGERLTTLVWTFPRVVLAEVETHRTVYDALGMECHERTTTVDISKNSASSRAIPIERMVQAVMDDPYMPNFTAAKKGMQGGYLPDHLRERAEETWLAARNAAVSATQLLMQHGVHKQDANRLLEPWAWVTQIVTATHSGWSNFFHLRCHEAAHPAFQRIARMAYLCYRRSKPQHLDYGQWHLPFTTEYDRGWLEQLSEESWRPVVESQAFPPAIAPWPTRGLLLLSVGRVCRVSYNQHDGSRDPMKDLQLGLDLASRRPVHASPLEHQGRPLHVSEEAAFPHWRSNLKSWCQLRKLIPGEAVHDYNPSAEEITSWGLDEVIEWDGDELREKRPAKE